MHLPTLTLLSALILSATAIPLQERDVPTLFTLECPVGDANPATGDPLAQLRFTTNCGNQPVGPSGNLLPKPTCDDKTGKLVGQPNPQCAVCTCENKPREEQPPVYQPLPPAGDDMAPEHGPRPPQGLPQGPPPGQ